MTDDLDGRRPEHVVFLVAECLTWRDNDTVTSVYTKRIEVLHVADCDAVVAGVTDDLILGLLPALERLLNQDLR